jgi:hypothetical protein
MERTQHAIERAEERKIPLWVIDFTVTYGKRTPGRPGTQLRHLDEAAVEAVRRHHQREAKKYLGVVAVVAKDRTIWPSALRVITVFSCRDAVNR